MNDRLLKIYPDVSERLCISRNRAYELVASGEIPSIRLSERSIRISERVLDEWIASKAAKRSRQLT